MKTTFIGQSAEERVAKLLEKAGFKILARNWRTRICEIDIVANKNKIIYFVEVKFRSSEKQGSGLEYITPKKLKQSCFFRFCIVGYFKVNLAAHIALIHLICYNYLTLVRPS
jgi:uncharacterized protein (TIGR00252 family)